MKAGLCGQVKVVSGGVNSLFLLTCDSVFVIFLEFFYIFLFNFEY